MNRKVTRKSTTTPRRIALELRHDRDGRYRWYEQETDADSEVSAATPAQAWQDAAHVWGADVWDFKPVSDTIAMINADDGSAELEAHNPARQAGVEFLEAGRAAVHAALETLHGRDLELNCPACHNTGKHVFNHAHKVYECQSCGTYHTDHQMDMHARRISGGGHHA